MKVKIPRTENGSSLIFVMSLSAIALIAALAITDSLLAANRNISSQAYQYESSSIAENSIQYGLAALNQAAQNGALSSFGPVIPVPPEISKSAQVQLTIQQIPVSNKNLQNSAVYSPLQSAVINSKVRVLSQDYRLLTAQVTYAGYRRTTNVIVGPQPYNKPGLVPTSLSASQTQSSFFAGSVFANSTLTIPSGISITDSTGNMSANVGSNSVLNFAQSNSSNKTLIQGTVSATSVTVPATNFSPFIQGDLNANLQNLKNNPFLPDNFANSAAGTSNVLHNGAVDGDYPNFGSALTTPLPPAPTLTPVVNAQLDTSGANRLVATAPSGNISDLGALSLSSGQTLILNPGQYTASSISIGDNASLQIAPPSGSGIGGNQPVGVQIYLQGNSGQTAPLTITGSVKPTVGNSVASNFQVFYNGNKNLNISPSNGFFGQVYAPNSSLVIGTNGGDFVGAATANNLTVTGSGNIRYDPGNVAGGAAGAAPGANFIVSSDSTNNQSLAFNILSWQDKTTGTP